MERIDPSQHPYDTSDDDETAPPHFNDSISIVDNEDEDESEEDSDE